MSAPPKLWAAFLLPGRKKKKKKWICGNGPGGFWEVWTRSFSPGGHRREMRLAGPRPNLWRPFSSIGIKQLDGKKGKRHGAHQSFPTAGSSPQWSGVIRTDEGMDSLPGPFAVFLGLRVEKENLKMKKHNRIRGTNTNRCVARSASKNRRVLAGAANFCPSARFIYTITRCSKRPLKARAHQTAVCWAHWGTTPGLNLIYVPPEPCHQNNRDLKRRLRHRPGSTEVPGHRGEHLPGRKPTARFYPKRVARRGRG